MRKRKRVGRKGKEIWISEQSRMNEEKEENMERKSKSGGENV